MATKNQIEYMKNSASIILDQFDTVEDQPKYFELQEGSRYYGRMWRVYFYRSNVDPSKWNSRGVIELCKYDAWTGPELLSILQAVAGLPRSVEWDKERRERATKRTKVAE